MNYEYFYKYDVNCINQNLSLQIAEYVLYIIQYKYHINDIKKIDLYLIYIWIQSELYPNIIKKINKINKDQYQNEFEYDNSVLQIDIKYELKKKSLNYLKNIINTHINSLYKFKIIINDINILLYKSKL